jgi:hypothetical protein
MLTLLRPPGQYLPGRKACDCFLEKKGSRILADLCYIYYRNCHPVLLGMGSRSTVAVIPAGDKDTSES